MTTSTLLFVCVAVVIVGGVVAAAVYVNRQQRRAYEAQLAQQRSACEAQLAQQRDGYERQLAQAEKQAEQQLQTLQKAHEEHKAENTRLLREQMRSISEEVLRGREEALKAENRESMSHLMSPLQQEIKLMKEAFDRTKAQQQETMTRLDESIRTTMKQSASLGESADRLTRALTGEVKVQGNFGEMKLKQLLERMELHEGEQYDTQETLRDKFGKRARDEEGHGLVPDFILHFPGNRHVVVDSKMSLTDYERYMNAEAGDARQAAYLEAHVASVRAQVKRLARKEYTRYLPTDYNRLDFAIMYIPVEGAYNLALLNDTGLWNEAYEQGVLILGPQTMYMNLRILEMMWTQVRQLENQQEMMREANRMVERVQDFAKRFEEVEQSVSATQSKIGSLKITLADGGPSIITSARKLIQYGAKESKAKGKKSIADGGDEVARGEDFIEPTTDNN